MWKKTGAWFYKGIPKYEVPQRTVNVRPPPREPIVSTEKPVKLRIKCVDTSSEEDEADAVARGDAHFTRDRPSSCKSYAINLTFKKRLLNNNYLSFSHTKAPTFQSSNIYQNRGNNSSNNIWTRRRVGNNVDWEFQSQLSLFPEMWISVEFLLVRDIIGKQHQHWWNDYKSKYILL